MTKAEIMLKQNINEDEYERRMTFARQNAAQAWCVEGLTSGKQMDPKLAEAFAKILVFHMYEPHMGLVTTREILNELTVRTEIHGNLDYKTCNGDV